MYNIKWKQPGVEIPKGAPSFVARGHIRIWNKQRDFLASHNHFKNWVSLVEWPEYMDLKEKKKKLTGEDLSRWNENPVLRDSIHPVVVDIPTFWAKKENLIDVMKLLKEEQVLSYNFLLDLTSADFSELS